MLISPELESIQQHSDLAHSLNKVWSGFTVGEQSAPVSESVELHKGMWWMRMVFFLGIPSEIPLDNLCDWQNSHECCGPSQTLPDVKGLKTMPVFLHQRFQKSCKESLCFSYSHWLGTSGKAGTTNSKRVGPVLLTAPPWPGAATTFPRHGWLHPVLPWASLAWIHWCSRFLESAAGTGADQQKKPEGMGQISCTWAACSAGYHSRRFFFIFFLEI